MHIEKYLRKRHLVDPTRIKAGCAWYNCHWKPGRPGTCLWGRDGSEGLFGWYCWLTQQWQIMTAWKNIRKKMKESKKKIPELLMGMSWWYRFSLLCPLTSLGCAADSVLQSVTTTMATRLFSWWQTHLWWNCCWTGGRRSASHSSAACPAHLTQRPKFLCQSLLLAFGKPRHCQVPAPANNSLGVAGAAWSSAAPLLVH